MGPINSFRLTSLVLDGVALRTELADYRSGGYVCFEGWVRNHNEGLRVTRLDYEAFAPLALREGERVMSEARDRYGLTGGLCVHRVGALELGDIAVWVGVAAPHRDEAFRANRYIIDEVKHRLPIWKKEHYENGDSGWVNCERCANTATLGSAGAHSHGSHAHKR